MMKGFLIHSITYCAVLLFTSSSTASAEPPRFSLFDTLAQIAHPTPAPKTKGGIFDERMIVSNEECPKDIRLVGKAFGASNAQYPAQQRCVTELEEILDPRLVTTWCEQECMQRGTTSSECALAGSGASSSRCQSDRRSLPQFQADWQHLYIGAFTLHCRCQSLNSSQSSLSHRY